MTKRQSKSGSSKKKRNPNPMVRQYAGQIAQLKRANTQLRLMLAAVVS